MTMDLTRATSWVAVRKWSNPMPHPVELALRCSVLEFRLYSHWRALARIVLVGPYQYTIWHVSG